jgi:hypothetical protein
LHVFYSLLSIHYIMFLITLVVPSASCLRVSSLVRSSCRCVRAVRFPSRQGLLLLLEKRQQHSPLVYVSWAIITKAHHRRGYRSSLLIQLLICLLFTMMHVVENKKERPDPFHENYRRQASEAVALSFSKHGLSIIIQYYR